MPSLVVDRVNAQDSDNEARSEQESSDQEGRTMTILDWGWDWNGVLRRSLIGDMEAAKGPPSI